MSFRYFEFRQIAEDNTEPFVVDGDSLLFDKLTDPAVGLDWGGQILTLSYLMESFILKLLDNGRKLDIVFFDHILPTAVYCVDDPFTSAARVCARACVIHHLFSSASRCHSGVPTLRTQHKGTKEEKVPDTPVQTPSSIQRLSVLQFPSPTSKEFKQYLTEREPAFAAVLYQGKESTELQKDAAALSVFGQVMRDMLGLSLDCASTRHVQFKNAKVKTFVVSWRQYAAELSADTESVLSETKEAVAVPRSATNFDQLHRLSSTLSASSLPNIQHGRVLITAYCIIGALRALPAVSLDAVCELQLPSLLLMHTIALDHISLEDRSLVLRQNDKEQLQEVSSAITSWLTLFLNEVSSLLSSFRMSRDAFPAALSHHLDNALVCDLFDGKLFHCLVLRNRTDPHLLAQLSLVPGLSDVFRAISSESDRTVNFSCTPPLASRNSTVGLSPIIDATFLPLRPLSSQLTQRLAANVDKLVDDCKALSPCPSVVKPNLPSVLEKYLENYHWHSNLPLVDEVQANRKSTEDDQYANRQLQMVAKFQKKVAESLLGSQTKYSRRHIIMSFEDTKETPAEQSAKSHRKKGHHKQPVVKSKDRLIQQNLEEKEQQRLRDVPVRIQSIRAEKSSVATKVSTLLGIINSESLSDPKVALIALKQLLVWQVQLFREATEDSDRCACAVSVYTTVFDTLRCCKSVFSSDDFRLLHNALSAIGFKEAGKQLFDLGSKAPSKSSSAAPKPPKGGGKDKAQAPVSDMISSDDIDPASRPSFRETHRSFSEFQLQFGGPDMARKLGSSEDSRVPFFPDEWQRQLLDLVDRRESALIVAPTSCGKTFISFYAANKVRNDNQNKIQSEKEFVVFIAPTKALVNQTQAEAYSRCGDIVGTFTRDIRHRVDDCQILVTTPEGMDILIMSPARDSWRKRIRYIIFDEAHEMDQSDSRVYERIITMVPCPFLALSATIGNPEQLHRWLCKVRNDHKHRVSLITHRNRWSDFDYYAYSTSGNSLPSLQPLSFDVHRLRPNDITPALVPIHPLNAVRKRGNLDTIAHLSLSAHQALQLWRAMSQATSGNGNTEISAVDTSSHSDDIVKALLSSGCPIRDRVQSLSPNTEFALSYIDREACKDWTRRLLLELCEWPRIGHDNEFNEVHRLLSGNFTLLQTHGSLIPRHKLHHLFNLILNLQQQQMLPAIAFCFDRGGCENAAGALTQFLEGSERDARPDDLDESQSLKEIARAEKQAKRERAKADRQRNKNRGDEYEAERFDEFDELPSSLAASAKAFSPGNRFSLLKAGEAMPAEESEFWMSRLRRKYPDYTDNHFLIRALHRGIGVHHAGLPKQYRDIVEVYFRKGHLRLVFATGTLALGVQMPCRTAIFYTDSPFLTPLSYHQMSGRAGRRGYDNKANVVFFDVPTQKLQHLLSTGVPDISGRWLLDVSFALKMHLLHAMSADKASVETMFSQIFHRSFYSECRAQFNGSSLLSSCHPAPIPLSLFGTKDAYITLCQFFFRYSQELLRNLHLIDDQSHPIGLAGMAIHLSYHEPGNLALVALLQSGHLGDYLKQKQRQDSSKLSYELMFLLCHLFNRLPLPGNLIPTASDRNSRSSPSLIVLEPLPTRIFQFIQGYNEMVLRIFASCLSTYADSIKQQALHASPGADVNEYLPLSSLPFKETAALSGKTTDASDSLRVLLSPFSVPLKARSPFVSPYSDTGAIRSARELVESTRAEIMLDPAILPVLSMENARHQPLTLNAYGLDFLKHGQLETIRHDNRLSRATADLLQDWLLTLKAINTSLEAMFGQAESDGPDEQLLGSVMKQLCSDFEARYVNCGSGKKFVGF